MNTYIKFTYVAPFEYRALEQYLNEMSQKGWQIKRMYRNLLYFKRDETKHHFHVCLLKEYDKDQPAINDIHIKKLTSFMNEFDAEYVCGYGPFQIFEGSQDIQMHTDDVLTLEHIKAISKQYPKPYAGYFTTLMAVFLIFFPIVLFFPSLSLNILFDQNKWTMFLSCLISFSCLLWMWLPRFKFKKAQELVIPKTSEVFSHQRTLIFVFPFLLFVCTCLYLHIIIFLFYYACLEIPKWIAMKYPRIGTLIGTVLCCLALYLIISDYDVLPKKVQIPMNDITEQIALPYDSYELTASLFGEMESYRLGKETMILHYTWNNDWITSLILNDIALSEYPSTIIEKDHCWYVPINDHEIWIFYDRFQENDIGKQIQQIS